MVSNVPPISRIIFLTNFERANQKEQERLEKLIADMQDKIESLEKPLYRKTIREDRKVLNGILG